MNVKTHPTSLSNMLINNFGHVVNDLLNENTSQSSYSLRPALELKEVEDKFILKVSVPGVSKKDIQISQEDGVLKVEAKRSKDETSAKNLHSEFKYGIYSREIRLPKNANLDGINAKLENGILSISITKKEEAKPKNIEVK